MAQQSKIQWTDSTWNPWHGCKKVSPGCKFCYMYRDKERYGQDPTTVLRSKSTFDNPLRWAKELREKAFSGKVLTNSDAPFLGMRIFTCSWSDFFIEEADQWRPEAWEIIRRTPEFTYQILTKRPERIAQCLPPDWGQGYENVWLGVSVESSGQLDRIQLLGEIPATVRFTSFEPLIDMVRLSPRYAYAIDWAIIGGESGNESGKYRYRSCHPVWIAELIADLRYSGVSIFVKQLGTQIAKEMGLKDRNGGDWSEWPEWLRLREFPIIDPRYALWAHLLGVTGFTAIDDDLNTIIHLALRAADDDQLKGAGLEKVNR